MTVEPDARTQLRTLQRALVGASDPQLRRILAMVDAMPDRGAADQLIAPLRPRLAAVQPHRPNNLVRLIFQPLNPLIVPGRDWRREMLAIPRTALLPLGAQVIAARAAEWGTLDPPLSSLATLGTDALRRLGTTIWPAAAGVLRGAPVPADWAAATGLADSDHRAIAAMVAAGLAQAPEIAALALHAAAGNTVSDQECERLLGAGLADDPDGLPIVATLLAVRLPSATPVLQAADTLAARHKPTTWRLAADRAVESLLAAAAITDPRPADDPAALANLRRIARLLADLAAMPSAGPARRDRIDALRRRLDQTSRQKFTDALEATLLRPAATLATADDATVAGLEAAARSLRRFEQVARRLGGPELYDQRLRAAAEALRPVAGDPSATLVDRVRLIEILQGPQAASAAMGVRT